MEEKKIIIKQPIDDLLLPFNPDTDLITFDMTVVIDRAGNFHRLDRRAIHLLNDSYWNKSDEMFGKKVTFINDYISFSLSNYGDGLGITAEISDDTKPTEEQLSAFINYVKALRKTRKDIFYSAWWRWTAGGGCITNAGSKLPGLFEKKLREDIAKHSFKGYADQYAGFKVVEG